MCHVFRCDTPARTIANTLRDICKRLMIERRPSSLATGAVTTMAAQQDIRKLGSVNNRSELHVDVGGSAYNQHRPGRLSSRE